MLTDRVSSQNVIQKAPKILSKGHPDLYWLNSNLVQVVDGAENYFTQYSPIPNGYLTASSISPTAAVTADRSGDAFELGSFMGDIGLDFPYLSDIESVTGELYTDGFGNLKAKYILKIRNTGGAAVAGVDARVYNPYA